MNAQQLKTTQSIYNKIVYIKITQSIHNKTFTIITTILKHNQAGGYYRQPVKILLLIYY